MRFRLALPAVVAVAAGAVALNSALREEPVVDRAVGFVPEGVLAYAHLAIDRDSDDWRRLDRAVNRVPSLDALRASLLSDVPVADRRIDVERDVRPWLGGEAAVALAPPALGERRPTPLLVLKARDGGRARAFLTRLAGPSASRTRYRGSDLLQAGKLAGAVEDGFLLLGRPAVVERALDVHQGRGFALTHDVTYGRLRDLLPDRRIADAFVTDGGAGTPVASTLASLGDFGVSTVAASLSIEGARARIAVRGLGSGAAGSCGRRGGGTSLVGGAPNETAALLEVGRLDCALRDLLRSPRSPLGRVVARLARQARRSGVSVERDLLPLLSGPGALAVTPTKEAAAATLVAGGVDERRALDVLGRLQPALIRLAGSERRGQAPTFEASDADGAPALTAVLGPDLQPSYAAFDGKLVVSTALEGIAAAHAGGGLGDDEAFRIVLGGLPERPAAVLFLDLDRLLALGERVGLAQAPAYLAVRDDLQKLGAVGLTLSREGKHTNAELLFKIP
jgi:uncharacterized protein DUF3352